MSNLGVGTMNVRRTVTLPTGKTVLSFTFKDICNSYGSGGYEGFVSNCEAIYISTEGSCVQQYRLDGGEPYLNIAHCINSSSSYTFVLSASTLTADLNSTALTFTFYNNRGSNCTVQYAFSVFYRRIAV